MLKDVYLGDWSCLKDLTDEFQIGDDGTKDYKVIIAYYEYGDYCGDSFVLLKKGRQYYEVNSGHCSCYGLEGQFDLEETTPLALKHRIEKGQSYGAFLICHDAIKQHFGW